METGSFYVVATPIGNLKDITLRALEVLKFVDYIACEDTRVTQKLLQRYEISSNLFDYHKFNEKKCSEKIIQLLKKGKSVALVSDAGTPGISDPGCVLYDELDRNDIKINSVPGVSAVIAFLSVLARESEFFVFAGFIPKNQAAKFDIFQKYNDVNLVFYDSPNRLLRTLKDIESFDNTKTVAVGREITKVFEEVKTGKVSEIIEYYENNTLKGEVVVMLYANSNPIIEDSEVIECIKKLKKECFSDKDISKILSSLYGVNKNKVYKLSIGLS